MKTTKVRKHLRNGRVVRQHSRKSTYGSSTALHKKISGMSQNPNRARRNLKGYKMGVKHAITKKTDMVALGHDTKASRRQGHIIYTKKGPRHRAK